MERRFLGVYCCLVEVAKDLASCALASGLLMIHDTVRGGEHNVAELTRRQQVVDPLFNVFQLNVKARADHATLVNSANQIHNNFAVAVVIDDFELPNVTCISKKKKAQSNDLLSMQAQMLIQQP